MLAGRPLALLTHDTLSLEDVEEVRQDNVRCNRDFTNYRDVDYSEDFGFRCRSK